MRHPRAGGALLAWCLVAAWTPAAQVADKPACPAVRGIAPGMRPSDVRARLGPQSTVSTVRGEAGRQTNATYSSANLVVDVLYDRDIAQDPEGRVVLVRARGPSRVEDPLAFVRSVVPGLGVPVRGGEYLQDGFLNGSTVWKDEACQLEITAYREQAEWWRPGERDVSVRIASIAASKPEQSEEPDAPQASTATALTAAAPSIVPASAEHPPAAPLSAEPHPDVLASENELLEPERQLEAAPRSAEPTGELVAPKVIPASQVEPRYPLRAMVLRVTASVTLRVRVRSDGSVGDVNVLDTTRKGMGFEQAATEAVKKWLYTPAMLNGQPEDTVITVRVTFD